MRRRTSRRDFLKKGAVAGAGFYIAAGSAIARSYAANDKLNIASVGAGGRAAGDIDACASENIVALCDVDFRNAARTFRRFEKATKYRDFREMFDKEKNHIDAVIVATPDHTHAIASIMAMRLGKHVYCEKPLTHDVYEARLMAQVARETKVATQMGNQGTASNGLRTAAEVIQSGAIGKVREVHVWTNRPVWPQGIKGLLQHEGVRLALHEGPMAGGGKLPVAPDTLAWDLWLGTAPARPYAPIYAPFRWRGWWDFGTGALGDMACHTMNLPWMALKLGAPVSVEAQSAMVNPETYPEWSEIRYEFPARGDMPPVTMIWYDGERHPPADLVKGVKLASSGSLFIGEKGMLYSPGDYGTDWRLLPEKNFEGYKPPTPWIPRSPGHHREWIRACKGGPPAMSNFIDYAGPLTEMVLLGNLAMRAGRKIEWNAKELKVTNVPEANRWVRREYRKGWEI